MATFGNTLDAYAIDPTTGLPLPGVELYAWAAESGGTPLLSLLSGLDGSFGWEYDTTADGQWVSAGLTGPRVYVPNNDALATRATTVYVDDRLATKANAATVGTLSARVDTTETRVGTVEDEVAGRLSDTALDATIATAVAPKADRSLLLLPKRVPGLTRDATVLTQFDTGHGWAAATGTGAVSFTDTTDPILGTNNAVVTASNIRSIQKQGLALNLTNKVLALWVRIDTPATFFRLDVHASTDAGFVNSYKWEFEKRTYRSYGGWKLLLGTFSNAIVTGTPNRAAIDTIRITVQGNSSTTATVAIGGVMTVPDGRGTGSPTGIVTFSFDDHYDSWWTRARPIFNKYGYPATIYGSVGSFGTIGGTITPTQAHALEDQFGWEIAGHAPDIAGHVDLTTLTEGQLHANLSTLKERLVAAGYSGADNYAYPQSRTNDLVESVVKQYFGTARVTETTWPSMIATGPQNPYQLESKSSGAASDHVNAINKAAANGEWLMTCWHQVVSGTAGAGQDIGTADLETILAACASSGIEVLTVRDVIDRQRDRQA